MSHQSNTQYQHHSILRYEQIFGEGFLSPGGLETTVKFCRHLKFGHNTRVLDIGSGLGGAAFYMAETFGAIVTGIDLSQEVIDIAGKRLEQRGLKEVGFRQGDVMELQFEAGVFDIVWSRDTFLHIAKKPELFHKLYRWLRPGGQLLITDYIRQTSSMSAGFESYIQQSGYILIDFPTYANYLAEAGFEDIVVEDRTEEFISLLEQEKKHILAHSTSFLEDFSQLDLDYLVDRWTMKIDFCRAGDMKWGLLLAKHSV